MASAPMPWVLRKVTPSTGVANSFKVPEANSQDVKIGEPVYVDITVGYAKKATASTKLLGVADENFANSASAQTLALKKHITELDSSQVWEATLVNGEDGIADVFAQTDLYKSYGIKESAVADVWVVNKADVSNKRVTIVEFVDPIGTVYGRVLFRFIQAYIQSQVADA